MTDSLTKTPVGRASTAGSSAALGAGVRRVGAVVDTRGGRVAVVVSVLALTVAVWQIAVDLLGIEPYILPPPTEIAESLYTGFSDDQLLRHTYLTAGEIVVGFLAGSALGISLGTLLALSRWADAILYPYVVAFNAVPKVAITPLIIIWFGTEFTSIVIVAALFSFFPLLVNTMTGLRTAVTREQELLMKSLLASRWQTFWMLRVPMALPSIFAGLEIAIVVAISGVVVGEFLGAPEGLGYYIILGNSLLDTAAMFSAFVLLAILGPVLTSTVKLVARRAVFWRDMRGGMT